MPMVVAVFGFMIGFGMLTSAIAGRAENNLPKSENFNMKWLFS